MHKDYIKSKRQLQNHIDGLGGAKPDLCIWIGQRWDEALDKDPEGGQCVLLVQDLIERLTPMKT